MLCLQGHLGKASRLHVQARGSAQHLASGIVNPSPSPSWRPQHVQGGRPSKGREFSQQPLKPNWRVAGRGNRARADQGDLECQAGGTNECIPEKAAR